MSVVIWHLPNRTTNWLDAGVAVLFFFIISGFYMALVINERYASPSHGWQRNFYASRLFRLAPAYLFMLVVMILWFKWTDTPEVFLNRPNIPLGAHIALTAMNLLIVGQDFFQVIVNSLNFGEMNAVTTFIVSRLPHGFFLNDWILIGQAWSLASEILFYAFAPFLVRSLRRIFITLGISLAIRWGLILGAGFPSEVWGYNFFPATLCFFLLGTLAYHLYAAVREWRYAGILGLLLSAIFAAFVIAEILLTGGVLLIDRRSGYDTISLWAVYIIFAASLPFLFAEWKSNALDRWIGELSYPLYIVHGLIIGIVFDEIPAANVTKEFAAAAASIIAAIAIFVCRSPHR
jgi:peptidoglycan/LPS O-acetylase OafA/YrhL